MNSLRFLLSILVCLTLCACATPQLKAWRKFQPGIPTASSSMVELTAPVLLVADTQEHEIGGLPISLLSPALDREEEVTVRTVYHSLYARKLFGQVLASTDAKMVIHLGDAMDLSCEAEWMRLKNTVTQALNDRAIKIPFYLLPGNHDGFMAGTMNPNDSDDKGVFTGSLGSRGWQRACAGRDNRHPEEDEEISKIEDSNTRRFLTRDVALKRINELNGAETQEYISKLEPVPAFPKKGTPNKRGCNIYTCSYLTQLIHLPPTNPATNQQVYLLTLDTSQTGEETLVPGTALLHESVGDWGKVLQDQILSAETLLHKAGIKPGDDKIVLFSGHHPWESLEKETRERLGEFFKKRQHAIVYISAHTHSGYWARHNIGGRVNMLELNVSSLADWPIASRSFKVSASADGKQIQIDTKIYAMEGNKPVFSGSNAISGYREETGAASLLHDAWIQQCEQYLDVDIKRQVEVLIRAQREYAPKYSGGMPLIFSLANQKLDIYRSKTPELCLASRAHIGASKSRPLTSNGIVKECSFSGNDSIYCDKSYNLEYRCSKVDYCDNIDKELIHQKINFLYAQDYYDAQDEVELVGPSKRQACIASYAAQVDAQLIGSSQLPECETQDSDDDEKCKVPNRLPGLGVGTNFYISSALAERH